jgi:hypothetical protein
MPEPLLHRSQINPSPQTPSRKRRAEFVQLEIIHVELGAFGECFQAVEEIELRIAA